MASNIDGGYTVDISYGIDGDVSDSGANESVRDVNAVGRKT